MSDSIQAVNGDSLWNDSLANELRHFLTKRLKCAEAAADLTHETYLRLHRQHNAADTPHDNARALAFHIAMNLAVDYQRKATVRSRYLADDATDSLTEPAAGSQTQPEHILIARQRLRMLQTALDELTPECRTAFLLHGIEGLKYAEIAARMGISVSMVGRHLAQAMLHCANRVAE